MPKQQTAGRQILVINDTPEILDLFREMLGDEGYLVSTDAFTADMRQTLDKIRQLAPNLVILDFIIGREGLGWQLLQAMKMDRRLRELPVIVCTAAARQVEELGAHLDEMGVAVVLKPFDIDYLLEEISRVWERGAGAADEVTRKE